MHALSESREKYIDNKTLHNNSFSNYIEQEKMGKIYVKDGEKQGIRDTFSLAK
jgi:hypothetical protein